jgi:hypothetical protein
MEFSSFYVEEYSLSKFTQDLFEMDRSLKGTATLKPLYEHNFVAFTMTETGQVHVEGKVEEYSHLENRMIFGFTTDQTCLGPFARDLAPNFPHIGLSDPSIWLIILRPWEF